MGAALVMDGDGLAGIFTERDILRALASDFDAAGHLVSHWMTQDPFALDAGTRATNAALDLMLEHGFRHVPVVDAGSRRRRRLAPRRHPARLRRLVPDATALEAGLRSFGGIASAASLSALWISRNTSPT